MFGPNLPCVRNERDSLHQMLLKMAARHHASEDQQRILVDRTLRAVPDRLDLHSGHSPTDALSVLMEAIAADRGTTRNIAPQRQA